MSDLKLRHERIDRPGRNAVWGGWPWLRLALAGFLLVLLAMA